MVMRPESLKRLGNLETSVLSKLPSEDAFNATLEVRYVRLDLGSIVILADHATNTGPTAHWAYEYYAPAAAHRLGLLPELCRFFLHLPVGNNTPELAAEMRVPPVFDDVYVQANLGKLVLDDFGRLCADTCQFAAPNLVTARLLEQYLGKPLSQHIGKTGVFYTPAGDTLQLQIAAYDGRNYYSLDQGGNHKQIFGQLVGFEE